MCLHCASRFVLGQGLACWGPRKGETLYLLHETANVVKRTGVSVVVPRRRSIDDGDLSTVMILPIDDLDCPVCASPHAVVQSLASNTNCPQCKVGLVSKHGACVC